MVTSETRQALAVIVSFGGKDGLGRWAQRMTELLQRYAAGVDLRTEVVG
jgi:hypothetical protein